MPFVLSEFDQCVASMRKQQYEQSHDQLRGRANARPRSYAVVNDGTPSQLSFSEQRQLAPISTTEIPLLFA